MLLYTNSKQIVSTTKQTPVSEWRKVSADGDARSAATQWLPRHCCRFRPQELASAMVRKCSTTFLSYMWGAKARTARIYL